MCTGVFCRGTGADLAQRLLQQKSIAALSTVAYHLEKRQDPPLPPHAGEGWDGGERSDETEPGPEQSARA